MLSIAVDGLAEYAESLRGDLSGGWRPATVAMQVVGVLVDEPSTRTRLSTMSGALRAGVRVIDIPSMDSLSIAKGETLADAGAVIGEYFDALAVRSARAGLPRLLSSTSGVPVLNLGDGRNEHPSQALATLVTIGGLLGPPAGRSIAIVGDLEAGRVAHSVFLAAVMCGMHVVLVPSSSMPSGYSRLGEVVGCGTPHAIADSVSEIARDVNVLYVTRDQKERRGGRSLPKYPVLSRADVASPAVVLHPLPRGGELPDEVWNDVRSVMIDHVKTTYRVRQRLLLDLLAGAAPTEALKVTGLCSEASTACVNADCIAHSVEREILTLQEGKYCRYCLSER